VKLPACSYAQLHSTLDAGCRVRTVRQNAVTQTGTASKAAAQSSHTDRCGRRACAEGSPQAHRNRPGARGLPGCRISRPPRRAVASRAQSGPPASRAASRAAAWRAAGPRARLPLRARRRVPRRCSRTRRSGSALRRRRLAAPAFPAHSRASSGDIRTGRAPTQRAAPALRCGSSLLRAMTLACWRTKEARPRLAARRAAGRQEAGSCTTKASRRVAAFRPPGSVVRLPQLCHNLPVGRQAGSGRGKRCTVAFWSTSSASGRPAARSSEFMAGTRQALAHSRSAPPPSELAVAAGCGSCVSGCTVANGPPLRARLDVAPPRNAARFKLKILAELAAWKIGGNPPIGYFFCMPHMRRLDHRKDRSTRAFPSCFLQSAWRPAPRLYSPLAWRPLFTRKPHQPGPGAPRRARAALGAKAVAARRVPEHSGATCHGPCTTWSACNISRLQGYKAAGLQGYKAARLQGDKATRRQGYKATGLQGHRASRLQGTVAPHPGRKTLSWTRPRAGRAGARAQGGALPRPAAAAAARRAPGGSP